MKIATFQQGVPWADLSVKASNANANSNAVRFGKAGIQMHNAASQAMFDMAYPSAVNTSSSRLNVLA